MMMRRGIRAAKRISVHIVSLQSYSLYSHFPQVILTYETLHVGGFSNSKKTWWKIRRSDVEQRNPLASPYTATPYKARALSDTRA